MVLFSLFICALNLCAYTVGEYITIDSLNYRVTSLEGGNYELRFAGTDKTGTINVPGIVYDGKGYKFTVTSAVLNIWDTNIYGNILNDAKEFIFPNTLTSLNIGGGVVGKTIHIPASLKELTLNSLTRSNNYVFDTDSTGKKNEIYFADEDGVIYGDSGRTIVTFPSDLKTIDGTYTINKNVTDISNPLWSKGIIKLILPIGLKTFTAPSSNTIKEICFEGGKSEGTNFKVVDSVLVDKNTNELVYYPAGLKRKSFTIPDEITGINTRGIVYANNLEVLNTNKVKYIDKDKKGGALYCDNLKTLIIGDSLSILHVGGDFVLRNLETINVSNGNKNFVAEDNVLYSKDKTILYIFATGGKHKDASADFTIPEGVKILKESAFKFCTLKTLTIPTSVTDILDQCFRGCQIDSLAFAQPSNVTNMARMAIFDSHINKKIVLPDKLTSLPDLSGTITDIEIPTNSMINRIAFTGKSRNIQRLAIYTDKITEIPAAEFQDFKKLKSVVLPKSITKIGRNAFLGCDSLESVTFPNGSSIETIGEGAFSGAGLKEFTIPASVKTIEREAFYGCKALTTVHLSANVDSISPEAFKHCENLAAFDVDKNNPKYSSVRGYLCSKDKSTLLIFPPAKAKEDITLLPPSVTTIADYAFYDCPSLTNIVIPRKVTHIGKRAFGLCPNFKSIAFLGDEMIPSDSINQKTNEMSFDDGSVPGMGNVFKDVTISCVRVNDLNKYLNDPFYKKFLDAQGKTTFQTTTINTNKDASGNEVEEEYFPLTNNRTMLLSVKKCGKTYVVPNTATIEGKKYTVNMIGDYAFNGASPEDVVLTKDVHYLGAGAFYTSTKKDGTATVPDGSTIKNVFFCGDKAPTPLGSDEFELSSDYNEFTTDQKIYVRKSKIGDFKAALPKYESQISYKIPGITISHKYGTFACEFDTDLNDYFDSTKTSGHVAAYVTGETETTANGTSIRMTNIGTNGGNASNNAYIPAYTPVLLRVEDGNATEESLPSDFYYTIGEHPDFLKVNKCDLVGVYSADSTIKAESGKTRYVLQNGEFRRVTEAGVKVPRHKAFLELDTQATAGAKSNVILSFPDGTATAINSITADEKDSADDRTYNLQGQRVENARHGVFIRNGKKFIAK